MPKIRSEKIRMRSGNEYRWQFDAVMSAVVLRMHAWIRRAFRSGVGRISGDEIYWNVQSIDTACHDEPATGPYG
jgi:hypothetical protein